VPCADSAPLFPNPHPTRDRHELGLCKLSKETSTTTLEPKAMVLHLPRTRLLLSEEETIIIWSGERAEGA